MVRRILPLVALAGLSLTVACRPPADSVTTLTGARYLRDVDRAVQSPVNEAGIALLVLSDTPAGPGTDATSSAAVNNGMQPISASPDADGEGLDTSASALAALEEREQQIALRIRMALHNLLLQPGDRPFRLDDEGNNVRDWQAAYRVITGQTLDVAPQDPARLFRVWTAAGEPRYTALGRFYLTADRHLVTASGLYALGPDRLAVPEKAAGLRIDTDGTLLATRAGKASGQALGRLELVYATGDLQPDRRSNETVFQAGAAAPEPVEASDVSLQSGVFFSSRIDPAAALQELLSARQERDAVQRALVELRRAVAAVPGTQAHTNEQWLTIIGDLQWSAMYLEKLGQPLKRNHELVMMDVSRPDLCVERLTRCLKGLRLRMRIHRENMENARTIKPEPYRRRQVVLGENAELKIEQDSSPLRRVYKPGAPGADENGWVLYPNVLLEVEYKDLCSLTREYNVLRQVVMHISDRHVVPEIPLPLPPAIGEDEEPPVPRTGRR